MKHSLTLTIASLLRASPQRLLGFEHEPLLPIRLNDQADQGRAEYSKYGEKFALRPPVLRWLDRSFSEITL